MGYVWIPDMPGRFHHTLELWIPGRPQPHIRPRMAWNPKEKRTFMYEDPKNTRYRQLVRHHFFTMAQANGLMDHYPWVRGPVRVTIHVLYKKPGNWYDGKAYEHTPDLDNLGKQLMDALNTSINPKNPHKSYWGAWGDDAAVVQGITTKAYGDRTGVLLIGDFYERLEPKAPPKKKPGKPP